MKHLLLPLCIFVFATNAFAAEPLPLSASQIEKLRAYLPTEEEGTPLIWKGDPLSITLGMHAEKRIVFPEPIEANLNGSVNSDQLRIINNDQSLYLTALKPFDTARMYVTLKNSNKIILLDISISAQGNSSMRTVKFASMQKDTNPLGAKLITSTSTTNTAAQQDTFIGSANTYVNAIRFAWQQLYAPTRLLNQDTDFSRTPMHTAQWVQNLFYNDAVLAHPEVSWISSGVYVTAVELRNKYPHATTLHMERDLCGTWQAATLYPRTQLKPAGDKSGDSTMLFLISHKPFSDTLEECHGSA